jgi:hypothetical protein
VAGAFSDDERQRRLEPRKITASDILVVSPRTSLPSMGASMGARRSADAGEVGTRAEQRVRGAHRAALGGPALGSQDAQRLHFGAIGAKMAPCLVCRSKTFPKTPTESCGSEPHARISPCRNTFGAV